MIIITRCATCGDEFEVEFLTREAAEWPDLRAHYTKLAHEHHSPHCAGARKLLYRTVLPRFGTAGG